MKVYTLQPPRTKNEKLAAIMDTVVYKALNWTGLGSAMRAACGPTENQGVDDAEGRHDQGKPRG